MTDARDAQNAISQPRCVVDGHTGRPVLQAPQRRLRPHFFGPDATAKPCPFCQGSESETPPELDAARDVGTAPDGPGWTARAFRNLYPAAEHHVVVAEGRAHAEQPARIGVADWSRIVALWQRCIATMERDVGHAFLFKNVGARAGASVAHNHSQLIGLDAAPPRIRLELAHQHATGRCAVCDDLAHAQRDGRVLHEDRGYVVFAPTTPRLPYETMLAPRRHETDFLAASADDTAVALHAWFAAVDRAFAAPPFNAYLHRLAGADFHWHFEMQLRTGNLAGLELGGDMYINSVPPAEAIARLRG